MDHSRWRKLIKNDKLKSRYARFQLECPMPIALRTPSRICPRSGLEYVKVRSLHLLAAAARPSQHRPLRCEASRLSIVYVRILE